MRSEANTPPVLNVEEARKILGSSYNKHSDEYIENLIRNLEDIIGAYIDSVRESH